MFIIGGIEKRGKFAEVPGEISPWQKLRKYATENSLEIKSLQVNLDGHIYNIPSAWPKFGGEIPVKFEYARRAAADVNKQGETQLADLFISISAIFESFTVTLWIDELRGKNCWVSVYINKPAS